MRLYHNDSDRVSHNCTRALCVHSTDSKVNVLKEKTSCKAGKEMLNSSSQNLSWRSHSGFMDMATDSQTNQLNRRSQATMHEQ